MRDGQTFKHFVITLGTNGISIIEVSFAVKDSEAGYKDVDFTPKSVQGLDQAGMAALAITLIEYFSTQSPFVFFEGRCGQARCKIEMAHVHPICKVCSAFDHGNISCATCRQAWGWGDVGPPTVIDLGERR